MVCALYYILDKDFDMTLLDGYEATFDIKDVKNVDLSAIPKTFNDKKIKDSKGKQALVFEANEGVFGYFLYNVAINL